MSDKIISDFLEINKDISMIGLNNKIKIFSNIKKKYYRKKLIKRVKILSKMNTPLNKDNIFELFSYIYSNYLPTGEFGDINRIDYYSKLEMFKAYIIDTNQYKYKFLVSVNKKDKKISLYIDITDNSIDKNDKTYTIELKELHSNNREIEKYINLLNNILINTMVKYILDIINSYDGKENEI